MNSMISIAIHTLQYH